MELKANLLVLAVAFVTVSVSAGSAFDCPKIKLPPPPENITRLHPGHVSLVMAIGDSITAGFAARSTVYEARDISWSIGEGSSSQLTFPWLLSQYSSQVEGQSTKAVIPNNFTHLPYGDYHPKTDHLNVAESQGAVHHGSLDQQWGYLRTALKGYKDLDSRWKVLTLWMTANDVCGQCNGPMGTKKVDQWVAKTEELLQNVTGSMKKVYINLIPTLDLSRIADVQRHYTLCKWEHKYLLNECGCIDKGNSSQLKTLDKNVHMLNGKLHEIAARWQSKLRSEGRTDAAVVVQPFLENLRVPIDLNFLNHLDCFHPSALGHQSLAVGLWNSMLCNDDRAGRCGQKFSEHWKPVCPDTMSFFYAGPDVVPTAPPL
jgi:hypothetical protein